MVKLRSASDAVPAGALPADSLHDPTHDRRAPPRNLYLLMVSDDQARSDRKQLRAPSKRFTPATSSMTLLCPLNHVGYRYPTAARSASTLVGLIDVNKEAAHQAADARH